MQVGKYFSCLLGSAVPNDDNCSLSLNVFNIGLQCNLRFLSTTVLQGRVATRVNYGKIFNDLFIANLPLSEMVKEF